MTHPHWWPFLKSILLRWPETCRTSSSYQCEKIIRISSCLRSTSNRHFRTQSPPTMRFPHLLRNGSSERPSSTSAIPPFEYSPLENNHIRIVYLRPRQPKQRAEGIECTLVHVAFGHPEYKALSYAWGDGKTKRTILLNCIKFEVNETPANALSCTMARRGSFKSSA